MTVLGEEHIAWVRLTSWRLLVLIRCPPKSTTGDTGPGLIEELVLTLIYVAKKYYYPHT